MKVSIQVELEPFEVPDFVVAVSEPGVRQDGMQPKQKYPLRNLDSYTLEKLCDDFRSEVFLRAGKSRPPQQG